MLLEYKEKFEKEKQTFLLEQENLQNSVTSLKQALNKGEFQLSESKKKVYAFDFVLSKIF